MRPKDQHMQFPILLDHKESWCKIGSIPWSYLSCHEQRALENHDQTFKQLARRGGLHPFELIAIWENISYRKMTELFPTQDLKIEKFNYLLREKENNLVIQLKEKLEKACSLLRTASSSNMEDNPILQSEIILFLSNQSNQ